MTQTSLVFDSLLSRYPKTVAAFSSMENGARALQAVIDLQQQWKGHSSRKNDPTPFSYVSDQSTLPSCPPEQCYDVIIAGGGLGLIAGAALAKRGLKVMVFDRDRVGMAHREWNISERELASLQQWGLFSHKEIKQTISTRYRQGLISFDAAQTGAEACPLLLTGVLDLALDAQSVLNLARTRFIEAGGTILEGRTFRRLYMAQTGTVFSVFEVQGPAGAEHYQARLAIDTMGSVSPIAVGLNGGLPFDGVCPTVGTVMEGLGGDPTVGDVLVSIAPSQNGRQLIWEGFPGKQGETTVYLFYYDEAKEKSIPRQSLLELFEQYFTLLPSYRATGELHRHLKPVFGYIPARHGRTGRTAARGLLCLGDSAAGQSPLTFCGFGSFVRHIGRVAKLIEYALEHDLLEEKHLRAISPHQANLRVAWVFSRFMQPWPGGEAFAVNRLMNIFCKALAEVGERTTLRFLQDRYTFGEYLRIMVTTARNYPGVFLLTARVLGPAGLFKWAGDIAAFAADDLLSRAYHILGAGLWRRIEKRVERRFPGAAIRLMAKRSGWRAIG